MSPWCLLPRSATNWARWLAIAAAVSILFSISAKELLLGAAIIALLVSRQPWRMPPGLLLPLGLFFTGTVIALVLSPDPVGGLAQIKKFYTYLIVPVLYTTLRGRRDAALVLGLCAFAGLLSATWSFVQFGQKFIAASAAGENFYEVYVRSRTTGFMSHWMTLGGQLMIVFMVPAAGLLFGRFETKWRWISAAAAGLLGVAMVLNMTRSVVLAAGLGATYLMWRRNPRLLLLLPLVAAAALLVGPVRERAISVFRPHGETDSNQHRIVCWRTGLEMVKAHPIIGVGPEQVGLQFEKYVPADISKLPEGWYGHVHNNFLQYAAERGLLTAAFLGWFLLRMLLDWWTMSRHRPPDWLLHAGIAVWIAMQVQGLFELNLGNTEVLHLFLVVAACAYVCLRELQTNDGDKPARLAGIHPPAVLPNQELEQPVRDQLVEREQLAIRSHHVVQVLWIAAATLFQGARGFLHHRIL